MSSCSCAADPAPLKLLLMLRCYCAAACSKRTSRVFTFVIPPGEGGAPPGRLDVEGHEPPRPRPRGAVGRGPRASLSP
eukprot:15314586-Alexandrium_andersonii.AAC.1